MALVVQKFGGTSMGDAARIRSVATKIIEERGKCGNVVVIVSAMAGETDRLIGLFKATVGEAAMLELSAVCEYDSVISTGEQVSAGLLAGVLSGMGFKARSLTGWQMGMLTNSGFSKAKIEYIATNVIQDLLNQGVIPVVTGFQGFNRETGRQTTLGRGGSDTSAVAIAAALGADRCDIYTDVDGIYSTDPRLIPNAKKLDVASFEEVIEMASAGAKVLEPRSVLLSMKYDVNLQVLSSFNSNVGSFVINDAKVSEKQQVSSITSSAKDVQVLLKSAPDSSATLEQIFGLLVAHNIAVDTIIKAESDGGVCDISFTANINDLVILERILPENKVLLGFSDVIFREDIVKLSIIGMGMKTANGVAHKVFQIMAENNIKIFTILTSEIKISLLISIKDHKIALDSLHNAFFGF